MAPSKAALAAAAAASNSSSGAPKMNPKKLEALQKAGAEFARKKVAETFKKSKVVNLDNLPENPEFVHDELTHGKYLGKGGFCTVHEVKSVNMESVRQRVSSNSNNDNNNDNHDVDDDACQDKAFIAEHCLRTDSNNKKKDCRYAIKKLSDEVVKDPARYIQGIMDMGVETYFLGAIEHPNIIKLRAAAECSPYSKDYFIVMDKLYDILDKKIVTWAKQHKKVSGRFTKNEAKQKALLEERMVAAFDLCAALEYLHDKRIVYRDLKPENIGFDIRGDIKLFDFGLAREVHKEDELADTEPGTYKMSGMTGSIRYMAPEVHDEKPYNFTCDTYSFAMLLWEMMAMETPFKGYNVRVFTQKVIQGGARPAVEADWPAGVRSLLTRGWSPDLAARPPMESCTKILKKTIVDMRRGDETGLEHMQRRSTYVLRKK